MFEKRKIQLLSALFIMIFASIILASCNEFHSHHFNEWQTEKEATCILPGEKIRYCDCGDIQREKIPAKGHIYDKGVCANCGDRKDGTVEPPEETCQHENTEVIQGYPSTCEEKGLSDGEKCLDCGKVLIEQGELSLADHVYEYNVCKVCGHTIVIPTSEIIVQLYENSANDALSSGLKRYYAGESNDYEEIDTLVRERNTTAQNVTGVNVIYRYDSNYGWGHSVDVICALTNSDSADAPDIYCNFVYDMTNCVLKGCFANLLSNSNKSTSTMPGDGNYFRFAEGDYDGSVNNNFDVNAGEGYLYDYMQSLAFANAEGKYDKLYCLASNYTLDVIRAFLVMPVNFNMLGQNLYQTVWDNEWDYGELAKLSTAVYDNSSTMSDRADIFDTLGFVACTSSGISGAAILYTTSVSIINPTQQADGTYTYEYPAQNSVLVKLSNVLYQLFDTNNVNGICTIDASEAYSMGYKSDLDAIRSRFSENKILFGGIVAVGNLEDEAYHTMNGNGFGYVPVPVYKSGDDYKTLVHNLARVVSIGIGTTEFAQCTAFLDYQSRNSAEILDAYVSSSLVTKLGNEAKNQKMLAFIRNHATDCFDKTYEDVISNYQLKTDPHAMQNRWHYILCAKGYVVTNMDQMYEQYQPVKQGLLEEVLTEWATLK